MNDTAKIRLGVNIDHVATLRNARGGTFPCPIAAAKLAAHAGADGITAHLREDRRHIRDADLLGLKNEVPLPLNFEMAATEEMLAIAHKIQPNACCLVPENRHELTTEGGLEVAQQLERLSNFIAQLKKSSIRVSLFIDPCEKQIAASAQSGADIVELHTGNYAHSYLENNDKYQYELNRLQKAALAAQKAGLEVHAGHGLTYNNVAPIAAIAQIKELNIGHFLIGEAVFVGLEAAIKKMQGLINPTQII